MHVFASKGYACYAPDMPGFGGSFDPTPDQEKDISTLGTKWYCEVFISALKTLELWSASVGLHIIGHHSGATLATELAATHPAEIRSILLVGATVMDAAERAKMKEKFFAPFNAPEPSGAHLLKTWNYLSNMGIGLSPEASSIDPEDSRIVLWQRELLDHVRAWKGRTQIYGAVWNQDKPKLFSMVKCPILVACAPDDVLFPYFKNVKQLRPDAEVYEAKGANFALDRDDGLGKRWEIFLDKIEQGSK